MFHTVFLDALQFAKLSDKCKVNKKGFHDENGRLNRGVAGLTPCSHLTANVEECDTLIQRTGTRFHSQSVYRAETTRQLY
jgi:hypothetical protein